jgi:hypothetical protein
MTKKTPVPHPHLRLFKLPELVRGRLLEISEVDWLRRKALLDMEARSHKNVSKTASADAPTGLPMEDEGNIQVAVGQHDRYHGRSEEQEKTEGEKQEDPDEELRKLKAQYKELSGRDYEPADFGTGEDSLPGADGADGSYKDAELEELMKEYKEMFGHDYVPKHDSAARTGDY